ncbi:MAG: methyl-accepting chemotaxis protein, partial [Gammaproteobacteria bacterium]
MATTKTGGRFRALIGVLLLLLLLATAVVIFLQPSAPASSSGVAQHVANAQNIALRAREALAGNPDVFDELRRRQRVLPSKDTVIAGLDEDKGAAIGRSWSQFSTALSNFTGGRDAVLATHDAAAMLNQRLPDLTSQLSAFNGALSGDELTRATPYIERIEAEILAATVASQALANGDGDRVDIERRLTGGDDLVNQILRNFSGEASGIGAPPVTLGLTQLSDLTVEYGRFSETLREVMEASLGAEAVRATATQLNSTTQSMFGAINTSAKSSGSGGMMRFLPLLLLAAAAAGVLSLMRGGGGGSGESMAQLAQATEQNETNQQAILRLLDEMGSLADGDLTVEATVSEDITGAIADSINYAIEALRDLVSTIDGAATEVERLAQQTDASANHLAKSSENQSKQVFAATESIANMAGSIEEVSGNAERSSDVARHSVEIAHNGAEAVRRTIDGMNTIRETIQDTSKRIKRLGESSQEIGNIVELINDIADQTNILALNASIQASMAGEAGRGFAVVADEVQRLSERCTNATKQIEVLVKTIQSDTNEAVVSMERSTTDVVSGALLAENAGASLDEIEKVSNQIASLVQNISG